MVQALHGLGLGVIMDVVYNHTNASGLNNKSVLDKAVPWYYHRINDTGSVEQSSCCENTATEHLMMEKLMLDSLLAWTEHYKVDGYRFDLMNLHTRENMENVQEALQAIDDDVLIYGEGWTFGELGSRGYYNATQHNMNGTGIGTFNDRVRDAVRGSGPFDSGESLISNKGFANGGSNTSSTDWIRISMAGNLRNFALTTAGGDDRLAKSVKYNGQNAAYADDPQENVNYVSKHDNQTLWDINQFKLEPGTSAAARVDAQVLGLSIPILSQGIVFLHMGSDLLRSKSMQRDSYDSGDWFNRVDFSKMANYWNVGLPREDKDGENWDTIRKIIADSSIEVLSANISDASERVQAYMATRQSSPLFRLATASDIMQRVDFHNTGADQTANLIVMSIDDGVGLTDLDPNRDALVVIVNATDVAQMVPLSGFSASDFVVNSNLNSIAGASWDGSQFIVPAMQTLVFEKPQGGSQGIGIPVSNKTVSLLFGDFYLRGSFNDDSLDNPFSVYESDSFRAIATLAAGSNTFRIADASFKAINFATTSVTLNSTTALTDNSGKPDDVVATINVTQAGEYEFIAYTDSQLQVQLLIRPYTPQFGNNLSLGSMGTLDYAGNGIYALTTNLSAQTYTFTLDDGAMTFGGGQLNNSGQLALLQTTTETAVVISNAVEYEVSVNVVGDAPVLSIFESLGACVELADASETPPLDQKLYFRGSHSDFAPVETYRLYYKGNNTYQGVFTLAKSGNVEFKIANDDANWTTQFFVEGTGGLATLMVDNRYTLTRGDGGLSNNMISMGAQRYAVTVQFTSDATVDGEVGKLTIQFCPAS